MAVNKATVCQNLYTAYENASSQLALLPAEDSFSEGGRSVSRSRQAIVQQMQFLRDEMDRNGCDVPGGAPAAVFISRARA